MASPVCCRHIVTTSVVLYLAMLQKQQMQVACTQSHLLSVQGLSVKFKCKHLMPKPGGTGRRRGVGRNGRQLSRRLRYTRRSRGRRAARTGISATKWGGSSRQAFATFCKCQRCNRLTQIGSTDTSGGMPFMRFEQIWSCTLIWAILARMCSKWKVFHRVTMGQE